MRTMWHKRDEDQMNNPINKIKDNQKTVAIVAVTALGISFLTLVIVMGMMGGRNANS